MSRISQWIAGLRGAHRTDRRPLRKPRRSRAPRLEALEERCTPVVGVAAVLPPIVGPGTGFDGVVQITHRTATQSFSCTGSLLSTGMHILTAAHCVDTNLDGALDPGTVSVRFDMPSTAPGAPPGSVSARTINGIPANTNTVRILPGWNGGANRTGRDLAIIALPQLAPLGAERYDIYRNFDEFDPNNGAANQAYRFIGYGRINQRNTATPDPNDFRDGSFGQGATDGNKHSGWNHFSGDGTGRYTADQNDVLIADFDDFNRSPVINTLGDVNTMAGNFESGFGNGDSGGPAFLGNRIAGVVADWFDIDNNGSPTDTGDLDVFTRTSRFAGWIDGNSSALSYRLIVNMTTQLGAADGVTDLVTARNVNGQFELIINGRLAHSVAMSKLTGVEIVGTADSEIFTIEGSVAGSVLVRGGGGSDRLIFDDPAPGGVRAHTYTVNQSFVERTGITVEGFAAGQTRLNFTDIDALEVRTSPGLQNTTTVYAAAAGTPVTITGRGEDSITVGSGDTDRLRDTVTVNGVNRTNKVRINDTGARTAHSVVMDVAADGYGEVRGLGADGARIRYAIANTQTVDFLGGGNGYNFTINNTASRRVLGLDIFRTTISTRGGADNFSVNATTGPLTINAGAGSNDFWVGGFSLSGIRGAVDLRGSAGQNTYTFGDLAEEVGGQRYILSAARFYRTDANGSNRTAYITYRDPASLTIGGGRAGNTYIVQSTPNVTGFLAFTTLYTGEGRDRVSVLGTTGPLSIDLAEGTQDEVLIGASSTGLNPIQGGILVSGAGSQQSVTLIDAGQGPGRTYTVNSDELGAWVEPTGAARIAFLGQWRPDRVTITAGAGGDTFNVETMPAAGSLTLRSGGGSDSFNINPVAQNLDRVQGRVTIQGPAAGTGSATLTVNDQANSAGANWMRTASSITRERSEGANSFRTQIDFDNIQNVVVNAGHGANVIGSPAAAGQPALSMILPLGSTGEDDTYAIATDAAGNVYVSGYFQGTIDLDPGVGVTSLTAVGTFDSYVAKYSPTGRLIWAKQLRGDGGNYDNLVWDIHADGAGNVYLSGHFWGTLTMDATTLTSRGDYDAFLIKLNSSGNVLWAQQLGGSGSDDFGNLDLDAAGNVVVAGSFVGTATLAGRSFTSAGGLDGLVARFSSDGALQWTQSVTGAGNDQAWGIAADGAGNVYVAGTYLDTVQIGNRTLTTLGGGDGFLAKLDNRGNVQWAQRLAGAGYDYTDDVDIDAAGNVYTSGVFAGTMTLGNTILTSSGAIDGYVTKLDSSGNFLWSRSMGSAADDWAGGLAVDAAGNAYFTGWLAGAGSLGGEAATTAAIYTGFLGKLDPAGNSLWTRAWGQASASAPGGGWAYSLALDGAGHIYVAGGFEGVGDQDPGAGTFTMTSSGNWEGAVYQFTEPVPAPMVGAVVERSPGEDVPMAGAASGDQTQAVMAEGSQRELKDEERIDYLTGLASQGRNEAALLTAAAAQGDTARDRRFGSAGIDWFFAHWEEIAVLEAAKQVVA